MHSLILYFDLSHEPKGSENTSIFTRHYLLHPEKKPKINSSINSSCCYQCCTIITLFPDLYPLFPGLDEVPNPPPVGDEEARTRVCTCVPDGVVDLAMGESGIEAEQPINVGQLFQNTVQRDPKHPALKYKQNGTWIAISYAEYYGRCIKAARSFLKVRVVTAGVYHAVDFTFLWLFVNAYFDPEMTNTYTNTQGCLM